MNKSYLFAVLMPVLFCIGAMAYLSTFEVPLLAQVQFSEKRIEETEGEAFVPPSVWEKVTNKENPSAKDLILALTELQKEADMQLDVEKVYKLQELEIMNAKMGEQIQKISRLERYFYFPPSTVQGEAINLDDVEIVGIFYGNANIKVGGENKFVRVGESIKEGKVKILEIRSDAIVFSVEGKKVEKAIKK